MSSVSDNEGAILFSYVSSKKLNKTELGKRLGMSKQNLYQIFKSRELTPETKGKFEKELGIKWDKIVKAVNIDVPREIISHNPITPNFQAQSNGKAGGQETPLIAPQDYKEKYISLLEKENERKSQIIEVNLTGLVVGQKSILAHLAVSLEYDALRDGSGNLAKSEKIKEGMDKRIGEVFSGVTKKGKTSGNRHKV